MPWRTPRHPRPGFDAPDLTDVRPLLRELLGPDPQGWTLDVPGARDRLLGAVGLASGRYGTRCLAKFFLLHVVAPMLKRGREQERLGLAQQQALEERRLKVARQVRRFRQHSA